MKNEKSGFKTKTYTFDDILELVHTDLCGPIGKKRYCGDKYIILFVDDYFKIMTMMFYKKIRYFSKF